MKHFFKIVSSCTKKKKIESCAKISIHFHTKNTAFSLTAIVGKITEKVNLKEWVRFSMNIQSMYKRAPDSKLKKGLVYLWIHNKDLQCKCPKIKLNKYVKFYTVGYLIFLILPTLYQNRLLRFIGKNRIINHIVKTVNGNTIILTLRSVFNHIVHYPCTYINHRIVPT